jgi:hypothetical protein
MEFAPIILTAQMGKSEQAWANALRQKYFPPERNFLDAHITMFHHLAPAQLPEIKSQMARICAEYAPPVASLSDVMHLGRGVAFRIECAELQQIRQQLAEHFSGLLTPQDQAKPRFHITVQNKVNSKTALALYTELSAGFASRPFAITGLSAFYYRGGPWQHIQSWQFRG